MSSFDTAREMWETFHMNNARNSREAAKNGDPEAMEILAYSIWHIQYNCEDEVIELLTAASDAGRETASWKLADKYAAMGDNEYHDKIEYYCRRALSGGRRFSHVSDDPIEGCLSGSIFIWINTHHPEWMEMEEGFLGDGQYYLCPTGRYGMNVFRGIGKKAATEERKKLIPKDKN